MELRPADPSSMDDVYGLADAGGAGPMPGKPDRSAATMEAAPLVVGSASSPAATVTGRTIRDRPRSRVAPPSRTEPPARPVRRGRRAPGDRRRGRRTARLRRPRPRRRARSCGRGAGAGSGCGTCCRPGASRWWCTWRSSRRWPPRRSPRRTRSSRSLNFDSALAGHRAGEQEMTADLRRPRQHRAQQGDRRRARRRRRASRR